MTDTDTKTVDGIITFSETDLPPAWRDPPEESWNSYGDIEKYLRSCVVANLDSVNLLGVEFRDHARVIEVSFARKDDSDPYRSPRILRKRTTAGNSFGTLPKDEFDNLLREVIAEVTAIQWDAGEANASS